MEVNRYSWTQKDFEIKVGEVEASEVKRCCIKWKFRRRGSENVSRKGNTLLLDMFKETLEAVDVEEAYKSP